MKIGIIGTDKKYKTLIEYLNESKQNKNDKNCNKIYSKKINRTHK